MVFERLGYWWRLATVGVSEGDLNRRPAPGVWSALEYGLHSAMVLPILRDGIELMLAHDRREVPDPCPDVDIEDATRPLILDPASILDALDREGATLTCLVNTCLEGWDHLGRMDDGTWWQAEATLLHIVHDTTHHFLDVGEGLARIGAAPPTAAAAIASVNVSGSSIAKLPVTSISVGPGGVEVDRDANSECHGPPFQAVCLWSSDVISKLAGQGHPVGAGAASGNLALSGVDWPRLRPGTRLLAGTALLELSYPAIPYDEQVGWFSDGDLGRPSDDKHREWSRWYAWVRRAGQVRAGDTVIISPS